MKSKMANTNNRFETKIEKRIVSEDYVKSQISEEKIQELKQ